MRRYFLAIPVMLTVATGCDNVTWGGTAVEVRDPPPRAELVADAPGLAASLEAEDTRPEFPTGPILLAGTRSGSEATLYVVGEVRGGTLAELPDETSSPGFRDYFTQELLSPGSEWTLFSQGVRVGRLIATTVGINESFCVARPTVTGTVELVPSASTATRLMALPAAATAGRSYGEYSTHSDDYDDRVGSLALATGEIPRVGAAWPPEGVLTIRKNIQVLQFVDAPGRAIAATFVLADRLAVAPPQLGAYSLFVIGTQQTDDYQLAFSWYRPADTEGKGVPRFFDHLDWDGDGSEEILLDVFGAESRWFAGLTQRDGDWIRSYQDSCGQASGGG
ncbi:MAG: hypothetical protein O2992_03665 [Gemmatimonadetes bacterium]|nr:hypothetical protein [Gemmatimonadota bacterium]